MSDRRLRVWVAVAMEPEPFRIGVCSTLKSGQDSVMYFLSMRLMEHITAKSWMKKASTPWCSTTLVHHKLRKVSCGTGFWYWQCSLVVGPLPWHNPWMLYSFSNSFHWVSCMATPTQMPPLVHSTVFAWSISLSKMDYMCAVKAKIPTRMIACTRSITYSKVLRGSTRYVCHSPRGFCTD